MMVWGQVESALCRIFGSITGMNSTLSRRVFYSARSFTGRTDMLKEAINCPTIQFSKDDEHLLKEAIKIARQYSSVRNVIAHDIIAYFGFDGHEFSRQWVLVDGKYDRYLGGENVVTLEQLDNFHFNVSQYFLILTSFLGRTATNYEEVGEQCLSLLRKLPKKPLESKLSQIDADHLLAIAPTDFHL